MSGLYQFGSNGNNQQQQQQPSSSLYGSQQQPASGGGLYGSNTASVQPSSSLYGSATEPATQSPPTPASQSPLYGSGGAQPRPGPPQGRGSGQIARGGQSAGQNPMYGSGAQQRPGPPGNQGGLYTSGGNQQTQLYNSQPAASVAPANQGALYGSGGALPRPGPPQAGNQQNSMYTTSPQLAPAGRTPPALSRTTSSVTRVRQTSAANTDISNFMLHVTVKSGSRLAAKDANGKSDPYVVCEFFEGARTANKSWTVTKTHNKSTTPVIKESLEPQWNFRAYVLNAKSVKESYHGIRFWCFDKDLVGTDDFMGEAFIGMEEIDFIKQQNKDYQLELKPRAKKKDKVSGFIVVSITFQEIHSSSDQEMYKSTRSAASLKSAAISRSSRVQITATGRREVKIVSSSGSGATTSWGELPPLEFEVEAAALGKHERKYGYHNNLALWLVNCAQLAYKDDEVIGDIARNVWDMYGYQFLNDDGTDTQGFCMHNDQILVVCFRGTESIRDWITNFNFVMVASPQYPQRYLKAGVRVHNGFNDALSSVWPQVKGFIEKALKSFPRLKIFVCGHSLGGALANLCFSYLVMSDTPIPVAGVYTVGQPRAGNKKFKEQLELASPNTPYIRFTNNQDCVPSLAGGQHCGLHVHITSTGMFTFDPPTWKRAASRAQAIQGSAANMQYAGIADHATAVYRKRIENYWIKSQSSKLASNDGAFDLCEQILFVIDFLTEDVKSVRRYKPQFRAMILQVIKMKTIIAATLDYFGGGVDANARKTLKGDIAKLFEKLSKLRKQVLARQSKKSIIQKANKNSESEFNKRMKALAMDLQKVCDDLNNHLKSARLNAVPKPLYDWAAPTPVEQWTGALYDIDFASINFIQISLDAKKTGGVTHTSQLLDSAEAMIEQGKLEEALATLEKLEGGNAVVGTLGEEDKAIAAFLKAKAHAKLHHHKEAMSALETVSNTGMLNQSMMQDSAFMSLRNQAAFSQFENQCANLQNARQSEDELLVAKLNNFELHTLARIFDDADDNGDNYLTIEEFTDLIRNYGGVEEILEELDWNEEGVNKQNILDTVIQDMRFRYNNATDLDQFISLMARLMPR